ncbi:hypothetical protein KFE96_07970 [Kordiimonas sp. SCSIO 12603]|uniref:hypothetical protein n=1 Tax=Kordiimonas sp. SCSIO 12603 TaxID=2829596 RepID=UPI00210435E0|nr:hypothetical protein [Kordiimonas sp. SCSIO 12603]UTW60238.1 hypothetical protein KFE96_07970 [Kordiimonas sp. SCSIO 12603]
MSKASTLLSVRLNNDERAELQKRAGSEKLSTYVKRCVFVKRKASGGMSREQVALILAKLASCDLAGSMLEMAESSRLGVLVVSPDTEKALTQACTDIAHMRLMLMQGLGKRS